MQEQKSEEQLKRQQHESARQKEYEKDRLKNRNHLKINDQSDESTNLTALRNQNRRTGQRSKKRETGHQTLMKRQGKSTSTNK